MQIFTQYLLYKTNYFSLKTITINSNYLKYMAAKRLHNIIHLVLHRVEHSVQSKENIRLFESCINNPVILQIEDSRSIVIPQGHACTTWNIKSGRIFLLVYSFDTHSKLLLLCGFKIPVDVQQTFITYILTYYYIMIVRATWLTNTMILFIMFTYKICGSS